MASRLYFPKDNNSIDQLAKIYADSISMLKSTDNPNLVPKLTKIQETTGTLLDISLMLGTSDKYHRESLSDKIIIILIPSKSDYLLLPTRLDKVFLEAVVFYNKALTGIKKESGIQ